MLINLDLNRMAPDRGLMNRSISGVKADKKRYTIAFTMNADGTEKLPPFFIGHFWKPRAFNKKTGEDLGFYYRCNAKAWMTTVLYQEWLGRWDQILRQQQRSILLLQDGFSAHNPPDTLTNIRIAKFAPNLTAHIQPADAGIIRNFKAHYRRQFVTYAIDRYDTGITPADIYNLNILQSIRMAEAAWRDVDTTTIRNCWMKTGILPDSILSSNHTPINPTISVASLLNPERNQEPLCAINAEDELTAALDTLQARCVLQKSNRMSITELLNPADEGLVIDIHQSDADIMKAVLDHQNGAVDEELDSSPEEPRPSPKDALAAAMILQKFTQSMGQDFARNLEQQLHQLTRAIRVEEMNNMRATAITDYFARK
jgi:hypothetical protein